MGAGARAGAGVGVGADAETGASTGVKVSATPDPVALAAAVRRTTAKHLNYVVASMAAFFPDRELDADGRPRKSAPLDALMARLRIDCASEHIAQRASWWVHRNREDLRARRAFRGAMSDVEVAFFGVGVGASVAKAPPAVADEFWAIVHRVMGLVTVWDVQVASACTPTPGSIVALGPAPTDDQIYAELHRQARAMIDEFGVADASTSAVLSTLPDSKRAQF